MQEMNVYPKVKKIQKVNKEKMNQSMKKVKKNQSVEKAKKNQSMKWKTHCAHCMMDNTLFLCH